MERRKLQQNYTTKMIETMKTICSKVAHLEPLGTEMPRALTMMKHYLKTKMIPNLMQTWHRELSRRQSHSICSFYARNRLRTTHARE